MGKVINADIPDEALIAQWVYRKLRNHDPMSERDAPKRHPLAREKNRQEQLNPTSNTVRYALNDGRVFEICVVQVEQALPAMKEVTIGDEVVTPIAKGILAKKLKQRVKA